MPPEPIKVLIAEDSPTVRHYLAAIIEEAPALTVAGMARTGTEAIQMVAELTPDVVSMDVRMPELDGLEATSYIMQTHPTPVVIVSGLVEREIDLSFRALQAGALAVVPKPTGRTHPDFPNQRQQLVTTLHAMAGVRVVRRWANGNEAPQRTPKTYHTTRMRPKPQFVAIAASAGGPSALAILLSGMGAHLSVPIVIVQHMPGEFISGLVRWLSKFTDVPVQLTRHGQVLAPGVVHLAPGGAHVHIYRERGRFVALHDTVPGSHRHQPAADVLFTSVAEMCGERGVGIVLTGMGDDGARGLLAMRQAGGRTFAQDEASSIVFGKPAAAIRLGAAERVMSPIQLAAALQKLL